jgi:hypothetical protein
VFLHHAHSTLTDFGGKGILFFIASFSQEIIPPQNPGRFNLWGTTCNNAYSDNIVFFAAAIEFLTGYVPVYIEGDFRQDRKDIFGQVQGVPETPKKRVIPILPAIA